MLVETFVGTKLSYTGDKISFPQGIKLGFASKNFSKVRILNSIATLLVGPSHWRSYRCEGQMADRFDAVPGGMDIVQVTDAALYDYRYRFAGGVVGCPW